MTDAVNPKESLQWICTTIFKFIYLLSLNTLRCKTRPAFFGFTGKKKDYDLMFTLRIISKPFENLKYIIFQIFFNLIMFQSFFLTNKYLYFESTKIFPSFICHKFNMRWKPSIAYLRIIKEHEKLHSQILNTNSNTLFSLSLTTIASSRGNRISK